MKIIQTTQDISIDFELNHAGLTLEFSESDAEEIEQQIIDAIESCNYDNDVEITGAEYVEGGITVNLDDNGGFVTTEDYFHMIITCDIEFDSRYIDETNGIQLYVAKFADMLTDLPIIGQYMDTSSIDVIVHSYDDDFVYVDPEPDWDSMPGGHDYYED